MKLLKHQQDIIDHLTKKCKNQHGMLVYHATGTGKSIVALSYMHNFIGKKILLILPEEIKGNWQKEFNKANLSSYYQKIKIITYNELSYINTINLETYVVVMDEAHNLIEHINTNTIRRLQQSYKILLLTATPSVGGDIDLIYLTNIAAGRDLLPYNLDIFNKKYRKVQDVGKSVVFGWVMPTLAANVIGDLFTRNRYINIALAVLGIIYKSEKLIKASKKISIDEFLASKGTPFIVKFMSKYTKIPPNALAQVAPLVIMIGVMTILFLLTRIGKMFDTYKINDIYTYHEKSILNTINPYVSYYKTTVKDPDYPESQIIPVYHKYTRYQVSVWTDAVISKTIKVTDNIINMNILNEQDYLNKGRIIGNYDITPFPPKFEKVFEIMQKDNCKRIVIYSNFQEEGMMNFGKFLNSKGMSNKKVYLYKDTPSNKFNKIIEDFKTGKIDILLLDPVYTEGISIYGVHQMHILEPIISDTKFTQLIGRVNRYHSHTHLPESQRYVNIYIHSCTSIGAFSNIIKFVTKYKLWFKNFKGVSPAKVKNVFDNELTPDAMILKYQIETKALANIISKNVVKHCG